MNFSYFDIDPTLKKSLVSGVKKLGKYRAKVSQVMIENDSTQPEYSLVHVKNPALHDTIEDLKKQFKGIKHLVLVGIGGSNLGTEAVHSVLDKGVVKLHSLDTTAPYKLNALLEELRSVRLVKKLAVCVVSKSGNTTETLVNAGVLLSAMEKQFGKEVYRQTVFIGDPDTDFMKIGKRLRVNLATIPQVIGGRYSVTTEVGLIPLALLGHNTDSFISGVLDATNEEFEAEVANSAARLNFYLTKKYTHYNFFAFDTRLERLGVWYRQLFAESIGKEKDRAGKPVKKGFVPTISTAVELHSVGQLYLSGFAGVYTDFVTFDDDEIDFKLPKKGLTKAYGGHTMQEVATAIYGGVMGAYQERTLPYRSTIFTDDLSYSLGLFIGMRMLETMYVAELLNLNAFDQPNVELYKIKTREILGL